jgi:hypothetical protein
MLFPSKMCLFSGPEEGLTLSSGVITLGGFKSGFLRFLVLPSAGLGPNEKNRLTSTC